MSSRGGRGCGLAVMAMVIITHMGAGTVVGVETTITTLDPLPTATTTGLHRGSSNGERFQVCGRANQVPWIADTILMKTLCPQKRVLPQQ
jgi:hypothetical protein